MARNIEIKARVEDLDTLTGRVAAVADSGPTRISQDDTFFHSPTGRLKLRMFAEDRGELIFYERPDAGGPKECQYIITPTSDPTGLRDALTRAWGVLGRVVKQRTLYLAGRTRIHLDRVQGLGNFLELEVVLQDDEPAETGVAEAHKLMRDLWIAEKDLVQGAYLDLLVKG